MTRGAGKLIGSALTALCVAGSAAGIALLVMTRGMPAHIDEPRATELTIQYENLYTSGTPEEKDSIKQEIISLRTYKWKLYNAGIVMSLTGPILLIAIIRFKLWDIRRLRSVTTPKTRLRLLGLASGAWLILVPAFWFELEYEFARDDLTPNIDTGSGTFFLFVPQFFVITLIAMVLFGRLVVLRNAALPVSLWSWDSGRPYRSSVWTIIYGLLGCILFMLIVWSIQGLPWALPSLAVGLYVIASTRAALVGGS